MLIYIVLLMNGTFQVKYKVKVITEIDYNDGEEEIITYDVISC